MSDYSVERLADQVWAIDDHSENSFYLIAGTKRALLIDTGASRGEIMPLLRTLTDLPIDLALTHAHIDHMYHAGEFERVYVGADDIRAWRKTLGPLYAAGHILYHLPPKQVRFRRFQPVRDGDCFDLGGLTIQAMSAPGHTPGSMIYIDAEHRILFTGDAFGSGEASWMWLPGCAPVSKLQSNFTVLLNRLKPYAQYRFMGGHRLQGIVNEKHPRSNPLNYGVLQNMVKLCGDMLSGAVEGHRVHLVPLLPLYVYTFQTASMVIHKRSIH